MKKLKTIFKIRKSLVFLVMLLLLFQTPISYLLTPKTFAQEVLLEDLPEVEQPQTVPLPFDPVAVEAQEQTDQDQKEPEAVLAPGSLQEQVLPPSPNITEPAPLPSANLMSRPLIRSLAKKSFRGNEKIALVIDNAQNQSITTKITDSRGEESDIDYEIQTDGARKTLIFKTPPHFKPGKYTIEVTTSDGQTLTQDFTWGVLAINTNKSIYTPNETAKLMMGVLDENGYVVCDAKVNLTITAPDGSESVRKTDDKSISVNPECFKFEVTVKADYETFYTVASAGVYQMTLSAVTKNGSFTITDAFEVRDSVPFDVERSTATRIYPPNSYPVDLKITANEDFTGTITDIVPGIFAVSASGTSEIPYEETHFSASSVEDVLGASTSAQLSLPYEGYFPISQEFSELLHLADAQNELYTSFGLAGHDGVDFSMPVGTPVTSVDEGTIIFAGYGVYGNTVIVQHNWGKSYYGHLSETLVEIDQPVKHGDKIALSGNTGISTGPHLHFSVKPNSTNTENGYYGKIDPLPFLGLPSNLDPQNQLKLISWNVSIKKGQTINLGYFYKAPYISPEFYKLGHLRFHDETETKVFEEARQWQIAADADGSGTNTVSPDSAGTETTGNTHTFTFTASETMDSGGFTITTPPGWSVPHRTSGTPGYTTVSTSGNATVGTVFNSMDSITDWAENGGTDACQSGPTADTTDKQEGSASITCNNDTSGTAPDLDDGLVLTFAAQNWSSYTDLSFWMKVEDGAAANDFNIITNDATDCATTVIQDTNLGAMTANTWTYNKIALTGTRTTVARFCVLANTDTALDNNQIWIDEILVGPGLPTFSANTINVRMIDMASSETATVTYGSGGGTSGAITAAIPGIYTFTTKSRTSVTGTLTNISSHPTVNLYSGNLDMIMHNGKRFANATTNRVSLVQSKSNQSNPDSSQSQSTVTASFDNTPTPGNLVVVGTTCWTGHIDPGAVTDNQGNSYTQIVSQQAGATLVYNALFYAKNIAATGTFTVTFNCDNGGALDDMGLAILEYANADPINPLDQFNSATANSTTPSTGNVTTSVDGEAFVAVLATDADRVNTPAGSFIEREELEDNSDTQGISVLDFVGNAQTTDADWTLNATTDWAASIATFRPRTDPKLPFSF